MIDIDVLTQFMQEHHAILKAIQMVSAIVGAGCFAFIVGVAIWFYIDEDRG